MIIAAVISVACTAWAVLFVPNPSGFWSRTTAVGLLLCAGSVATLLVQTGGLEPSLLRVVPVELALGAGVGLAAYTAARIAYPLARRYASPLADAADELFELRSLTSNIHMGVAIVVMGTGEELLFRGLLQPRTGLLVTAFVYAAVQLVARNLLLVVLGVAGGLVWGSLYAATGSLLAPILAHVIPVTAIALRPPRTIRQQQPSAPSRRP